MHKGGDKVKALLECSIPIGQEFHLQLQHYWTEETTISFELIESKLVEALMLILMNFSKNFQIECFAFNVGIGVMSMQEKKVMAHFSDKLNGTGKNNQYMRSCMPLASTSAQEALFI